MKLLFTFWLLCINNFSAPAGETKECHESRPYNIKEVPAANLPLMPSLLIVDIY